MGQEHPSRDWPTQGWPLQLKLPLGQELTPRLTVDRPPRHGHGPYTRHEAGQERQNRTQYKNNKVMCFSLLPLFIFSFFLFY